MTRTAFGSRGGSKIALIVLHGDAGPAQQSLAAMTALGARASDALLRRLPRARSTRSWTMPTRPGTAAWPIGTGGVRTSTAISLGVLLERGPDGYSDSAARCAGLAGRNTARARYELPADAVMGWGQLDPRHADDPAGFPMKQFQRRLRDLTAGQLHSQMTV